MGRCNGVMRMRIWRRYGHKHWIVVPILALVLVSGCAGTSDQQSPADSATPVATQSTSTRPLDTSTDADSPSDPDEGNVESGDDGLAWVPFGPKDPTFPTPSWPAYNAFAEGKCAQLQDYLNSDDGAGLAESDLALAMVAVCKAAFLGQQEQWDVAEEHEAGDSGIQNGCLDAAVKELMERALAWHEQNPGKTPVVQIQRAEEQTECGKQSTEVDVDPPPAESPSPDETTQTPSTTQSPDEPTESTE